MYRQNGSVTYTHPGQLFAKQASAVQKMNSIARNLQKKIEKYLTFVIHNLLSQKLVRNQIPGDLFRASFPLFSHFFPCFLLSFFSIIPPFFVFCRFLFQKEKRKIKYIF